MGSFSSCESRGVGGKWRRCCANPQTTADFTGASTAPVVTPWPSCSSRVLGCCDSSARTEFGSASQLWPFSVHNIRVVCLSMALMCREGKPAGAVTCSVGPFLLGKVGGREKMPLQNIWFEQEGAVSALLSQHTATHQKTSVRGGQHSSKSGTRKCCTISNTQNKRMISCSPNGIYPM